ncbi:hypothetical protein GCM10009680_49380 [Streptomyces yatensis]|uniref:Uncharacterized protein n=1 Tax=Streptomyces yatensis TaxID=155177 RepID=A0ABN2ICX6_9ACTN
MTGRHRPATTLGERSPRPECPGGDAKVSRREAQRIRDAESAYLLNTTSMDTGDRESAPSAPELPDFPGQLMFKRQQHPQTAVTTLDESFTWMKHATARERSLTSIPFIY